MFSCTIFKLERKIEAQKKRFLHDTFLDLTCPSLVLIDKTNIHSVTTCIVRRHYKSSFFDQNGLIKTNRRKTLLPLSRTSFVPRT